MSVKSLSMICACARAWICLNCLCFHFRIAACAVSGSRADFSARCSTSYCVSAKTKTSCTNPWKSTQGSSMFYSQSSQNSHCLFLLNQKLINISFIKASIHDPVSLVPLSLVPVDPCDIHVELAEDQVSIESSSSLPCSQEQTLTLGSTSDHFHCDSSSGAVFWDSGGMELELCLDSGISIRPVSHCSEEVYRTNGDWKT